MSKNETTSPRPRGRPPKNPKKNADVGRNQVVEKAPRNARTRKARKLYTDDWPLGDEEIEGMINFYKIGNRLEDNRYVQNFVKEMNGADFNVAYLQRNGFNSPILVKDKTGLGLRVPSSDFSVSDVKACVGSRRMLDVMDVMTQKNFEMTMKEWQRYYDSKDKNKLYNVISLEFSHTKLENFIRSPTLVRQIDWVDCVWPRHLKEAQKEATNSIDDMMYPKVQKYCLMSVKGCYTDFHIDFGGTSVWYHILKGCKVFFLIPPSEVNILLYEKWVLSGKQSDVFFGDIVEKCARITLYAGNTFFIPSGWIHAVYTVSDSLVFGGNFLHSFGIEKQLRIAQVEDITKVPQKHRFPFFTEMLWYALERYVYFLLGQSHLRGDNIDVLENRENMPETALRHVHLTKMELIGLKEIIKYVHNLPLVKKNLPPLLKDPVLLVKDVRRLIESHCNDNEMLAITGQPVLTYRPFEDTAPTPKKYNKSGEKARRAPSESKEGKHPVGKGAKSTSTGRRRRTRCKVCRACRQSDCGECVFCQDMVKFGGPGRAKQTCIARQCLQPMLPVTACCSICNLDGWGQQLILPITKVPKETPSTLMECSVCYDICHFQCIYKDYPNVNGVVNEDMPNSWECPKCCSLGRNVESKVKPRHFPARQKTAGEKAHSIAHDANANNNHNNHKSVNKAGSNMSNEWGHFSELSEEDSSFDSKIGILNQSVGKSPLKKRRLEQWNNHASTRDVTPVEVKDERVREEEPPRKPPSRLQLGHQTSVNNGPKTLKKPLYAVRPAPLKLDPNPTLFANKTILVEVFKRLKREELNICARVCKAWANASIDPSLWRKLDLTGKKLTANCLTGITKRQPETLILDWTPVARKQLEWLVQRLPQLRELSLQGCSWGAVAALRICMCPPLTSLDLSYVSGLNDAALRDILSPPKDSRPGLVYAKSRLRNLRCLKMAGCDVSDVCMRYVVQNLPQLEILDLSQCARITDAGIAQLMAIPNDRTHTLEWLDVSANTQLTDLALDHLVKCPTLRYLDMRQASQITNAGVVKFLSLREDLVSYENKWIIKRERQREDEKEMK